VKKTDAETTSQTHSARTDNRTKNEKTTNVVKPSTSGRKKNSPLNKIKGPNLNKISTKEYTVVDINNEENAKEILENEKTSIINNLLGKKQENNNQNDFYDTDDTKMPSSYSDYDEDLEFADLLESRRRLKKERKQKLFNKIGTIALIVASVYMIFLIYGVFNTPYVYNDNGKAEPEAYSVQEIAELNEFNSVYTQYQSARTIYENILNYDYRLGTGMEDSVVIATNYEKELDNINTLLVQTKALEVSSQYSQIITMLVNWGDTDASYYCQNMSAGISQNDTTAATDAQTNKVNMYNDFMLITQNLASIGDTVKGADTTSLYTWSPDNYVSDTLGVDYSTK
jgi:hypothetical protein